MFSKYKRKDILRQPKVYVPPKEQVPFALPKYLKWSIIILIIIIGLGYLLFFSPIFKIRHVEIIGNSSPAVAQLLNSFKSQNIFRLDSSKIQEDLEKNFPEYLEIKVSRGIPNILRTQFTARQAKIVWQSDSNYYLVDKDAYAFLKIDNPPANLIKTIDNKNIPVDLPGQIASNNFIDFLENSKTKLSALQITVDHFEVNETTFQVTAVTDNNIKIIFDVTRNITDQIDAFDKVYQEHKDEIKQYIDLRVEGKVYYQ